MLEVSFTPNAWGDYQYWLTQDKKTLKRINSLIKECLKTPFEGTGKPEPLKHLLGGCWSRRIDKSNRMVYLVENGKLRILQLRKHY
ncbi:MAG: Txe/YoeB family addiction module toxin [Victivallaceae bacterium]|nr:Txe/YoeB family addiction module toxin [Victivallaceae bacterium]